MQLAELTYDLLRVKTNLLSVDTHIRPAEEPARPARQIVALEPF
jgi:hypothetical protein